MEIRRPAGSGWLALIGGGEFTFGETVEADRAWVAKTPPGKVGFLPAASGSSDYGELYSSYLREGLERSVETLPIYRSRDARRGKNLERIGAAEAIYIGGGVADHLLDCLAGSPANEALLSKLRDGGTIVAIAAAAHALGKVARGLRGETIDGLSWLGGAVVEPNFDPAHDRRLRTLLAEPGVAGGVGLPAGSALLLGPAGEVESIGLVFVVASADGDVEVLGSDR